MRDDLNSVQVGRLVVAMLVAPGDLRFEGCGRKKGLVHVTACQGMWAIVEPVGGLSFHGSGRFSPTGMYVLKLKKAPGAASCAVYWREVLPRSTSSHSSFIDFHNFHYFS